MEDLLEDVGIARGVAQWSRGMIRFSGVFLSCNGPLKFLSAYNAAGPSEIIKY